MSQVILIVEDDEPTREVYRDALTARGYPVVTATNGAEGVHLARRHQPSLILLDVRMPVMDGWHALRYIRSDHRIARTEIWGISAYFDQETSPAPGFDRLIPKPLDPADLVREVEAHLGPPLHTPEV